MLVKGSDYDPAAVVGAAEVTSWGGRVVCIPNRLRYLSTTAIIERDQGIMSKPQGPRPVSGP